MSTAPPEDWAALSAALGEPLAPALGEQLFAYVDLLARWNGTYNLTAVRSRDGMLKQHLADCLALIGPLRRHLQSLPAAPGARRVLDVGSGGGLPGVVVAACLPECEVTCVDTVAKKAAFVRQVAAELALPRLHAAHSRVEALRAAPFDIVASRAFASLADFTRLTRHLLAPQGTWLAMKGKRPDDELAALDAGIDVFHVEPLHVPGLGAERCLVWMRPRASAQLPPA